VEGFDGVSWLILDLNASFDGDVKALGLSAGGGSRFVEEAVFGAGSLDENLGMPVPAPLVGLMGILESCMSMFVGSTVSLSSCIPAELQGGVWL